MAKRQFCQLAHVYNPKKHSVPGQFISEKLDGQRAIWDGGVSRGLWKDEVPYANTYKDERFKERQKATGLWSRYGNVIHAPDWFLNNLPRTILDIELYAGRGQFQFVQSVVRDLIPGVGWKQIDAVILDAPPPQAWLADGIINERNCKVTFKDCHLWWGHHIKIHDMWVTQSNSTFEQRLNLLRSYFGPEGATKPANVRLHKQVELPFGPVDDVINRTLDEIVDGGGEGLVIKRRNALYTCDRSWDVLKVKPHNDAEATVVGYYWGEEADNTRSVSGSAEGKYLGKMGSLLVEFQGKQFKLSGFTDQERMVEYCTFSMDHKAPAYMRQVPGQLFPADIHAPHFPRGSQVTFKYRELSDDGIPKEARYLRTRTE